MAADKDEDKKIKQIFPRAEDEDEDESGSGTSSSGQIEFREFVYTGADKRDDLLSFEEKKRLLAVHQDLHEARVEKQKKLRDERKALKEGKISLQTYRQGLQSNEGYEVHPLSNEAQFSGARDNQVNEVPGHEAQTNNDKRQELRYNYNLQNRPEYANKPTATPKPNPFNR